MQMTCHDDSGRTRHWNEGDCDMVFQFDLNDIDSENGKWNLRASSVPAASKIIDRWQKAVEWNSLFLSNHDEPRPVSRWGCTDSPTLWARSAKALGGAMHLLRGTSFIYQGEEIGMTNAPFRSCAELRDLESLNYLNLASGEKDFNDRWKAVLANGRDNARTPMQWNADRFGGFSCAEPWMMINPDYRSINVASQEGDPDSILNFYKKNHQAENKGPAVHRWKLQGSDCFSSSDTRL
ncbi:MAG: alpha-amylase family glycosyl hydrolase [Sphaerochaetaceae bacterium]